MGALQKSRLQSQNQNFTENIWKPFSLRLRVTTLALTVCNGEEQDVLMFPGVHEQWSLQDIMALVQGNFAREEKICKYEIRD